MTVDPSSYRDLAGQVHVVGDKIYRNVTPYGRAEYEAVRDSGVLEKFIQRGWLIPATECKNPPLLDFDTSDHIILEHPRLPVVSYPWEWSFSALKSAAILHLDLHRELLQSGYNLVDASAYNMQFIHNTPIFIDYLSFRRYKDREPWYAHQQFCDQFLNPLILQSHVGVPFQPWYRGHIGGLDTEHLLNMLKLRKKLSLPIFSHVVLPGMAQNHLSKQALDTNTKSKARPLSYARFDAILSQLRNFIDRLEPANITHTTWREYTTNTTYSDAERSKKHQAVQQFCARLRPSLLVDLGSNTGEYAFEALSSGAGSVVGLESDIGALETAFLQARQKQVSLMMLYQDLADPSPGLGWAGRERPALKQRLAHADAVLALALVHHLAIGKNVPLRDVIKMIIDIAERGIIEFVPKDDPTVEKMLENREDVFPSYTWDVFRQTVEHHTTVISEVKISGSGRTLLEFDRSGRNIPLDGG